MKSLNLLPSERPQNDSIPITSMMSTSKEIPMSAMNRRNGPRPRFVKDPAIPGLNPRQRVGWIDRTGTPAIERAAPPAKKGFICHECYEHGHIAPDCVLPLRQVRQVITNYEALTTTEGMSVPPTLYDQVFVTSIQGDFAAPSEPAPQQRWLRAISWETM